MEQLQFQLVTSIQRCSSVSFEVKLSFFGGMYINPLKNSIEKNYLTESFFNHMLIQAVEDLGSGVTDRFHDDSCPMSQPCCYLNLFVCPFVVGLLFLFFYVCPAGGLFVHLCTIYVIILISSS